MNKLERIFWELVRSDDTTILKVDRGRDCRGVIARAILRDMMKDDIG